MVKTSEKKGLEMLHHAVASVTDRPGIAYVRIRGKEERNAGKGRLWGYFRTKNFIIHHR